MKFVGAFVLMGALALAWFFTLGQPEGAKVTRSDSDFAVISNAIKTYAIIAGRPPTTEQGLMALVQEPVAGPKPRRWTQIMKKIPTDPWGRPYDYRIVVEEDRAWRYEIRSGGIDGIMQTGDDYVSEWGW